MKNGAGGWGGILALARQVHETLLDVEEDVWALHTAAH